MRENDIQKLADEYSNQYSGDFDDNHTEIISNNSFIAGYKAATKIYTESDLREAIAEAWCSCEDNVNNETFTQVFNRIIKSFKE